MRDESGKLINVRLRIRNGVNRVQKYMGEHPEVLADLARWERPAVRIFAGSPDDIRQFYDYVYAMPELQGTAFRYDCCNNNHYAAINIDGHSYCLDTRDTVYSRWFSVMLRR